MEENSGQSIRGRYDPSLELARQRAELLGLPPPPEPRTVQDNTIPSSPPPSYEHVLAEVSKRPFSKDLDTTFQKQLDKRPYLGKHLIKISSVGYKRWGIVIKTKILDYIHRSNFV
jgi:hypothetical protein